MEHNQPPAFFVRGPSPLARLAFFAAVSIALMAADSRLHYLTEIRQGFTTLLHPLEVIAGSPFAAFQYVSGYFVTQETLSRDNRRLRQLALQQGTDLQRFRSLQAENEHLRRLLDATQTTVQSARLGEIIHAGRDPFTHKVVLNVGVRHGVAEGQAAIDEFGVIGQVTRAFPFSSEVTLVTDKDLAVPVQIERTGMRAIAFGHGRDGVIDLPYLPANVDVREGDMLVTSGIDGVYPTGLAVAKVTRIERNSASPFAHIVCQPVAGITSHRQVLLIASTPTPAMAPPGAPETKKPNPARSHHAPGKP